MYKRGNRHEIGRCGAVFELAFFFYSQAITMVVVENRAFVCRYGIDIVGKNSRQIPKLRRGRYGVYSAESAIFAIAKVVEHHHRIESVPFAAVRRPQPSIDGSCSLVFVSASSKNEVK